jgi:MFS family permease
VTTVGIIGDTLQKKETLGISSKQVGLIGTIYISGAVIGALLFGLIADRFGRKKLFLVTPTIYLVSTLASSFSWNYYSFVAFNFFAGVGIGGEYSAINSAINEFIPARVRGWVDLVINGSYWLGAMIGAAASVLFLDPHIFKPNIGWRLPFMIGSSIGLVIVTCRLFLPESPRWLMTHGRVEDAEMIVRRIEDGIERRSGVQLPVPTNTIVLKQGGLSFAAVVKQIFCNYFSRAVLSFTLVRTIFRVRFGT